MYYSTQQDPQHSQKIVQQTTADDFDSWDTAIDVVASQFHDDRPGMSTVAKVLYGLRAYLNARANPTSFQTANTSSPSNTGCSTPPRRPTPTPYITRYLQVPKTPGLNARANSSLTPAHSRMELRS